jgi:hypothetical protein
MAKLGDIAAVVRSKNAGPFHLTFDIIFADRDAYERVKATGVMSAQTFGALYGLSADMVEFHDYPPARAFKFSIPRPLVCGDIGDGDIYGAQQHAPLLMLEVPISGP